MYDKISNTFYGFWESFIELLPNLIIALLFQLLFIMVGKLINRAFKKTILQRSDDPFAVDFVGKAFKWIAYIIGSIIALHIIGFNVLANSILTGAGISALILGFAFKDIIENILSGILLAIHRPFNMGNIVEIKGIKGTIKGLDLRTTHIRNMEGKDIYIPNSMMTKEILVNFTKDGFLRMDFDLGLDVPADFSLAKSKIIKYLNEQPEVLNTPKPDVLIQQIGSCTLDIKVLFWVNVLKDKSIPPSYLGATIKSRIIDEVKIQLLADGYALQNPIVELKMYDSEQPISIINAAI